MRTVPVSLLEPSSPKALARLAGVFFVLEATSAVFGQFFVLGRLVVREDAAATAANILAHETLFRLGFAASLAAAVFHIVWAWLFYVLLRPVRRNVALLAGWVVLVGCALQAVAALLQIVPWSILASGDSLAAFSEGERQALALVFLRLNAQAFNGHVIFFGVWCGLVGYLIYRSTFLPRTIGLLMILAGIGYLTLLYGPLAKALDPFNVALAAPGEISLLIWLLVKGVDEGRWRESARGSCEAPRTS